MKITNIIYFLLLFIFSLVFSTNCKKRDTLPIVKTGNLIEVNTNSAILSGEVIADGGAEVIARGVCWNKTSLPITIDNITSDGTGIGSFTSHVNGLAQSVTYYFRAYATNSAGTSYGESVIFSTIAVNEFITAHLTAKGANYVVIKVSITSDGGSPITARGICWGTTTTPTIADNKTTDGKGIGSFTTRISGLDPNTIYFFRVYVTNPAGTTYVNLNDLIAVGLPSLYTQNVIPCTSTSAIVSYIGYEWVPSQGVCWSTSLHPTIADNKTEEWSTIGDTYVHQCTIKGLTPNTTFFLRAFATNLAGTGYGNEYSFVLEQFGGPTVSDIDGILYHTVTIGTQVWMVENLKTTSYRNGDPIPIVTDANEWYNLTTGAYCNLNNDPANPEYYGKLYNWYAVNDGRKIAPAGWHVPDETEFTTLINYLKNNGYGDVGKSMAAKSAWSYDWNAVITDYAKNNSSGFTAFPAGTRGFHGNDYYPINSAAFSINGQNGTWWTVSESNGIVSYFYLDLVTPLISGSPNIGSSKFKMDGFSVRCIKD